MREWDLTRDPGPAAGLGIFATPAVLVDGARILLGVPTEEELLGSAVAGAGPVRRALVLNASGDGLKRAVFEALTRAGCVPIPADSVAEAVEALSARAVAGVVVAFNARVDLREGVVLNGIRLWAQVARSCPDPAWRRRPIIVTTRSRAAEALVRREVRRYGVTNPVVVVTRKEAAQPSFSQALSRHFSGATAGARRAETS